MKIQKGIKYSYFAIQSGAARQKHWAPRGVGTVRDEQTDGQTSESVD